jgi:lysozyme
MKISERGIELIRQFEGCKLVGYADAVGIPTVGYGHTGPEVYVGKRISQPEANALLAYDLAKFEKGVTELTTGCVLNQNQFDALVSFSFNVGLAALKRSTLLRKLKAGDSAGAAAQFLSWTKAGGKVLKGLVRRRAAERDLFLQKD